MNKANKLYKNAIVLHIVDLPAKSALLNVQPAKVSSQSRQVLISLVYRVMKQGDSRSSDMLSE